MMRGNNANSGADYNAALTCFKEVIRNDPGHQIAPRMSIECFAKISQIYLSRGQLDSARVYTEGYDRLSDLHFDKSNHWPMILFGELYRTMGRTAIADEYYLSAIERSRSNGDPMAKTTSLYYYLIAHLDELSSADFLPYFEEYLTLTSRLREDKTIEYVHAQMLFGEMSPDEQVKLLHSSVQIAIDEHRSPLPYQLMLTDLLILQSLWKDALLQAQVGLELTKTSDDVGHLIDFHKRIAQIFEELGDLSGAYPHLQQYYFLKDSLDNVEMSKNLDALNVQYQTAKKENALLEKSREVQLRTNQRNLLMILVIGLLLLGSFIVLFFLHKARLSQQIAAQEHELNQHQIRQLQSEKKLIALSSMIEGQEAERMRIARDLHDGLGGLLATVKSHVSTAHSSLSLGGSIGLINKISELVDHASTEVRRISHNMAPQALRIGSLKEAISDLATNARTLGLTVEYEWHGPEDRLPENTEIMLYRITQELVHNVIKHAQATHLLVQINRFENEISIVAEDDGIGFDASVSKLEQGLGLKSLHSRVEYLDGILDIDSQSGAGTTISIQVPVR
jgi:signal transduction histidine kinase